MRAADIKRMDRVVEYYNKIADLLETVHHNTLKQDEEWMPGRVPVTVSNYIGHELIDVLHNRDWFVGKLRVIKEMQDDSKEAL